MSDEHFFMKCPQCKMIYPATKDDIVKTAGLGKLYVPCPRRYSDDEVRKGRALKRYCTGYPEYPKCLYNPEN